MRGKREWRRIRSPHARVLESLEAAVALHPSASGRRHRRDPDAGDRADELPAGVIALVPRRTDRDDPDAA